MATLAVTGISRLCFINVLKPNEHGKYSIAVLVPKSDTDTVAKLRKVIEDFKTDPRALKTWDSKFLASFKTPLRDGDTERDTEKRPEYKGHYFFEAKTNPVDKKGNPRPAPKVVDAKLNEILDPAELYSGCYGRVSIDMYPYNFDGNKGMAFGLVNVQKVRDGDRLSGDSSSAADDFTVIEEDFLA
jgi:hypothetical protein